jgi:hypothetical protein
MRFSQAETVDNARAEEHHVLPGGDEVECAEVGESLTLESAGVIEVELLHGACGRGTLQRS